MRHYLELLFWAFVLFSAGVVLFTQTGCAGNATRVDSSVLKINSDISQHRVSMMALRGAMPAFKRTVTTHPDGSTTETQEFHYPLTPGEMSFQPVIPPDPNGKMWDTLRSVALAGISMIGVVNGQDSLRGLGEAGLNAMLGQSGQFMSTFTPTITNLAGMMGDVSDNQTAVTLQAINQWGANNGQAFGAIEGTAQAGLDATSDTAQAGFNTAENINARNASTTEFVSDLLNDTVQQVSNDGAGLTSDVVDRVAPLPIDPQFVEPTANE